MNWRERAPRFRPDMPARRRSAAVRGGLGRLFVWVHAPGSALQGIAVLLAVGALGAWVFHAATGRTAWRVVDAAALLWVVGAAARRWSGRA